MKTLVLAFALFSSVSTSAAICEVQLHTLTNGKPASEVAADDRLGNIAKEVFTDRIQDILDSIHEAGFTLVESSEFNLTIDLSVTPKSASNSKIVGTKGSAGGFFENNVSGMSAFGGATSEKLPFSARLGLSGRISAAKRELHQRLNSALSLIKSQKESCN